MNPAANDCCLRVPSICGAIFAPARQADKHIDISRHDGEHAVDWLSPRWLAGRARHFASIA